MCSKSQGFYRSTQSASELIAQQTAEFLASGRQILEVPTNWGAKPVEPPKDEWIDTLSAALIIGVCRRTLRQMLSDTTKAGAPCIVTKMENGKRMWLRSSVEALRDKRRAA